VLRSRVCVGAGEAQLPAGTSASLEGRGRVTLVIHDGRLLTNLVRGSRGLSRRDSPGRRAGAIPERLLSTATLEPRPEQSPTPSSRRAFSLVFHRDKEPFCDVDLIGPVVYYVRSADFAAIEVIRVYVTPDRYEDIRVERW
jgi:hypothetical protein